MKTVWVFHEGMLRERIFPARQREPGESLPLNATQDDPSDRQNGEIQSIVIDVPEFCSQIERHAAECVKSLRDATNIKLRDNFKNAVGLSWRTDKLGRAIGISSEEWDRRFR